MGRLNKLDGWVRDCSHRFLGFLEDRLAPFTLMVLLAVTILSILFWDSWIGDEESVGTAIRNLVLVMAAIAALPLAIWRSKVAERQAATAQRQSETAQRGLLNERYQKGAEMLGSKVLAVRLGGIYALARLAREHPEDYHVQIMSLLCAFVRNPPTAVSEDAKVREGVRAVITAVVERSEAQIEREKQENCRLDLSGANLKGAFPEGAVPAQANLKGAVLAQANLEEAFLYRANLEGADLTGANLKGAVLAQANLEGAFLCRANLEGVNLVSANLKKSALEKANLEGASLSEANLEGAFLDGANLEGAFPGSANLEGAFLDGANLKGAFLTSANLKKAKLRKANLEGAHLSRANLEGAVPISANLEGADLDGANLNGAGLTSANLKKAKLREANLEGAYLWRANLEGAVLTGANLKGCIDLTQEQLDQAVADFDNPPNLSGHCCPAKTRTESTGWGFRLNRLGSPMLPRPVKWALSRKE